MQASRALPLLLLLTLSACRSAAPPPAESSTGPTGPLTLAEVLPLTHNTVSSFETHTEDGSEGLLILGITRPREGLAELEIAGRVQRLQVEPSWIGHATGGELLREPLEVGATFPGAFGTVRITEVNVPLSVPAGQFQRCVFTLEESQNPPKRVESAYCSGVGLTRMLVEAETDEGLLRMESLLTQHGPRVDLNKPSP